MRAKRVDPGVQALLDEAGMLPDCAARDSVLERAAACAEALDDLDTAWSARCRILSSSSSHAAPRFESLFLCLAWCLAMSDRDPDRFPASDVLWQYKWVATAAPGYASVPRGALDRLVDDMDVRFVQAGWGRRAGLHKRIDVHMQLGECDRALALVQQWRQTPRDRGSDCIACEVNSLSSILAALDHEEEAVREARPIIQGRMSCSTVPHSTFGDLLLPLVRLKNHAKARELYDRGRRLVAAMDEGGCGLAEPYILYGAFIGETEQALAMLRVRLPQTGSLRSDLDRMLFFAQMGLALEHLDRRGVKTVEFHRVPGVVEAGETWTLALAERFRGIARPHAAALDKRNGNGRFVSWMETLADRYGTAP